MVIRRDDLSSRSTLYFLSVIFVSFYFAIHLVCVSGHSLGWLQEKCTTHDWTVCAYLARFLVPSSEEENNPVRHCFVHEFCLFFGADLTEHLRGWDKVKV